MRTVVFVGPTLAPALCREVLDAEYLPPVAQGDVHRVVQEGVDAIGIIDGYFERIPAVWHKEILWAMARGVPVFGAASMGALRAAELAPFGMIGVGSIFEAYRDGLLENDDEVTLIHLDAEDGYAPTSVALVDIRATLLAAEEDGVISPATHDALLASARATFYPRRCYPDLLERARTAGLPAGQLAALEAWLPNGCVSQKRDDAVAMLQHIKAWQEAGGPPASVDYHFEHTDAWEQVVSRGGRAPSRHHDDPPGQWLLDELRLRRSDYERTLEGAFARALALAEAERHGITLDPDRIEDAVTALRRKHALSEPGALPGWLAAQRLDAEAFADFMESEARIAWVQAMCAGEALRQIPGTLRARGSYGAVVERAQDKQRVLAAHGVENPTLADAPLDEGSLVTWFFEQHLREPRPERLDLHVHALGYSSRASFVRAVLREYYYVALRGSGLPPERRSDDGASG